MPGSGKTLCASHLQQRGYFQFRFGGIVVDEVLRRGWVINPENERIVREELRAHEGIDAIARRALPTLKQALETHRSLIIDGLYGWSEYRLLNRELGASMIVVAVVSRRGLRYERLAKRLDRPLTPEEAQQRDYLEIENLEKGGPIAIADYTLLNDGDADAMLSALDAVMASLGFVP